MEDDNNNSLRKRQQRRLTYSSWRQEKHIQKGNEHEQCAQQQYASLLNMLEQNYSQARLQLNQIQDDSFCEAIKQVRKILQNHDTEMQIMFEDLNKQIIHNKQAALRLQEYEIANSELKMLMDRTQYENSRLNLCLDEYKETLDKVNSVLTTQSDQKQQLHNQVRQLILVTESQQTENKSLNNIVTSLISQKEGLKQQISSNYVNQTKLKDKITDQKVIEVTIRQQNQHLQGEIQRLNNELDQKKYLLSRCISVNHNDQTDSMVNYFKIVQDTKNEDDGDDLECLRNVEKGYEMDLVRRSSKQFFPIEDFDKVTKKEDQFYRKSTGRSKARKQSETYLAPMSDRRTGKQTELFQKQTYNNCITKIRKHKLNPTTLPGIPIIKNNNQIQPSSHNNHNINDLNVTSKKLDTKTRSQIGEKTKNKKNITLPYASKNAEKTQQIQQIRSLKQQLQNKIQQNQALQNELKQVKREVVNKCEAITKLQGENQMQISELKLRLEYEKRTHNANFNTIVKMKGNIVFLKNLVISLIKKMNVSEQYYREIITQKCQQFLQSQCSLIETTRTQVRLAMSSLLKFYNIYVACQEANVSKSEQNIKIKRQMEEMIQKLEGCDLETIRKARFKSSRLQKNTEDDEMNSSKHSVGSLYETVLNEGQVWGEGQPDMKHSSLKKSHYLQESMDLTYQLSISDQTPKLSIFHQIQVKISEKCQINAQKQPDIERSDQSVQTIHSGESQIDDLDVNEIRGGAESYFADMQQSCQCQTERVLVIDNEEVYLKTVQLLISDRARKKLCPDSQVMTHRVCYQRAKNHQQIQTDSSCTVAEQKYCMQMERNYLNSQVDEKVASVEIQTYQAVNSSCSQTENLILKNLYTQTQCQTNNDSPQNSQKMLFSAQSQAIAQVAQKEQNQPTMKVAQLADCETMEFIQYQNVENQCDVQSMTQCFTQTDIHQVSSATQTFSNATKELQTQTNETKLAQGYCQTILREHQNMQCQASDQVTQIGIATEIIQFVQQEQQTNQEQCKLSLQVQTFMVSQHRLQTENVQMQQSGFQIFNTQGLYQIQSQTPLVQDNCVQTENLQSHYHSQTDSQQTKERESQTKTIQIYHCNIHIPELTEAASQASIRVQTVDVASHSGPGIGIQTAEASIQVTHVADYATQEQIRVWVKQPTNQVPFAVECFCQGPIKVQESEASTQAPSQTNISIQKDLRIQTYEQAIQVINGIDKDTQTEQQYQVYDYKDQSNHKAQQVNIEITMPQLFSFNKNRNDKTEVRTTESKKDSSVISSQSLAFHSEALEHPMRKQLCINPEKKIQKIQSSPHRESKLENRAKIFMEVTPSTTEKSPQLKGPKTTKSPKQIRGFSSGNLTISPFESLSMHYQLTQEDISKLTPERMFEMLIPCPENSVYLQNTIERLDKQYKWDKKKLYMLAIVDEKDRSGRVQKLLMWKRGLASLENCTQLRVKPKGEMYDDLQMFTLGNSEVVARGNHIWVRRKNNRCSSVYGNFIDGNWKIQTLWVYSIQ